MMMRVMMKVDAGLYPIVKPNLTSSTRCGCDNSISRCDKAAMNPLIDHISLPNDAEIPGPSPAHIRLFTLLNQRLF